MKTGEVRIVQLDTQRVAAAYGFGSNPEFAAWEKILAFAREQGLLDGPYSPRFFGFNPVIPDVLYLRIVSLTLLMDMPVAVTISAVGFSDFHSRMTIFFAAYTSSGLTFL